MPYGDSPTGQGDFISSLMRIDWKSALFGGAVVMAAAYLGVMRPASRQITALETQVNRLAASVESLNESRDGVTRATSLLGRIEAQAARPRCCTRQNRAYSQPAVPATAVVGGHAMRHAMRRRALALRSALTSRRPR